MKQPFYILAGASLITYCSAAISCPTKLGDDLLKHAPTAMSCLAKNGPMPPPSQVTNDTLAKLCPVPDCKKAFDILSEIDLPDCDIVGVNVRALVKRASSICAVVLSTTAPSTILQSTGTPIMKALPSYPLSERTPGDDSTALDPKRC